MFGIVILALVSVNFCGGLLCADATRGLLQSTTAKGSAVQEYVWHVNIGSQAPDCFQRDVILVNGIFQPTLTITQGQYLQVTVVNDMPADFPSVADGISIHWHGFSMRGYEWYDGTGRITQCPIAPGTNFTYYFQVNEQPGSYFWHDHSASNRADGLQGALIVLPSTSELAQYDAEETLFITDWFHGASNALQFTLSRPFAKSSQTKETGQWQWVGLPQANLINGKGFYGDCALIGGLGNVAGVATVEPKCNVTTGTVAAGKSKQQPWAAPSNPGCTHENITVTPGQTYRFRIINGGSLLYHTVCFQGHNVTVIAADATPTQEVSFGPCIDVNSGQRYDVLLTAHAPVGNYWITVQPQYRLGSPNGYGILHYEGAPPILPPGPTPQPGAVKPWSLPQLNQVVTATCLLQPNQSSSTDAAAAIAEVISSAASLNHTTLQVPLTSNRTFVEQITQPLLNKTGQLRWALNNRANTETPSCEAKLSLVQANNGYYDGLAASSQVEAGTLLNQTVDSADDPVVLMGADGTVLEHPTAGQHVISIDLGEVIDIVIENKPANSYNGDLTASGSPNSTTARNSTEQHPFHLHGHHFWVLATGNGTYNSSSTSQYNTINPIYRDTHSVLKGGWSAIRFVADNPGLWFYHCHILWHQVIGQGLVFVEGVQHIRAPPSDLPVCDQKCNYDFGGFTPAWVAQTYGETSYDLPGVAADIASP